MRETTPRPTALVVDDDPSYRILMRQYLELAGFVVIVASDGRQALRVLEERPVSVLVTDLIMPEIEGLELIQRVKRGFPGLRIVAVSGDGRGPEAGYLRLARLFGADAALPKPFSGSALVEAAMPSPQACAAPAN